MTKIRTSRGFARFKNISRTPAEYASSVEIMTTRPLLTIERLVVAVAVAFCVIAAIVFWGAV